MGPELDLEALERGDAEALAAVPEVVTGIEMSPCVPEEEEETMEDSHEQEDEGDDLELGAVTVELKARTKAGGGGEEEDPPPRAPRLEEVAALPPLLQGQGLAAAGKRRKKLQKRAEKIASKLSDTLVAAMQF
ncbi:hypothetical protein CIB84_015900 [Bambusicola thoracicus]|uniref:Uncharacterized protein n=1 Tax=Bambusicola thoracicus TaxID=9083 RepID=A0A2P4S8C4_BAMTH|nr:hypothetical protein CIB84_015900 [Bambusicola thoracicus]